VQKADFAAKELNSAFGGSSFCDKISNIS